ncbi:macro domain-containing protein [Bacteroidaceae bacterium HV4-6-C5C]|nr:macro domain-containing protein [Bacteroidaceae bacterium HV4-6-C5C]
MKYITGDLLSANTQALVNTVNTVGVMGKGIALQFKENFPSNYNEYIKACKNKELEIGKLLVVKDKNIEKERIIINFPTKKDWKHKSKLDFIDRGLQELVKVIHEYAIKSIAIPPLGCGNGGLDWEEVEPLMEKYLSPLENIEILIFKPNKAVKEILMKQELNKEVKMTDAKAMLLYAMYFYETGGEASSLFVANKISFFYQLMGAPEFKKIKFSAEKYGPYSVNVGHMVHALNGKYIRGLEQMKATAFEPLFLNYNQLTEISGYVRKLKLDQIKRISNLTKLITGFQSALSLEVLASVAWIRRENPSVSKEETIKHIANWSERKKNLFKEEYVYLAWNRLEEYANLNPFLTPN